MRDVLTLDLTDIVHGGDAIGRHEGKVIFVPGGIPSERVRVRVVEDKRRYARAQLLEVLSPAPSRVQPSCPHCKECGGCQWQHISYEAQLQYKQSIVRGQLQRVGGIAEPVVQPTRGMSIPWHYRNHVQLRPTTDGRLGFRQEGSHTVVPIEYCNLMHPLLEEMLDALDLEIPDLERLSLRAGINTGEQMMIFEMQTDEGFELEVTLPISVVMVLADGTPLTLVGSPYLHEIVAGRRYRISAKSFFQVNTEQAAVLVSLAQEAAAAGPDDTVVDVYCGVGTFTLALAEQAGRVVGIESNPGAIADALVNAQGMEHVSFIEGQAAKELASLEVTNPIVIVDPPRSGLEAGAVPALLRLAPQRIVYVSCDPASMARDIKALGEAGYRPGAVQPVDMFPQTCHVECVLVMSRE